MKSCGPKYSKHSGPTGRQVGDKWRQVGGKPEIMRAENPECSGRQLWETYGRQVRDHADQSTQSIQRVFCRQANPETNAKSCGPSMHPFQRSKNPSQVNLFGEKA